ncbi:MAG: MazG nucleotide pyrophosphohydrolase domain-containing protein [Candidatus Aenigmatarchaeota archaeon]
MELKKLLDFIETEDRRLIESFGDRVAYDNREKRILARTVKLTEELGELCDEILAQQSLQRKEKLDSVERKNLGEECADVVITALLLYKALDVDIESELDKKTEKISKRYD